MLRRENNYNPIRDIDFQNSLNPLRHLTFMRPGNALLVYLLFVFVGAAALAPWVYFGLQALATHSTSWHGLAAAPFRRIVDRCLLILALLAIWPLIRALKIRSFAEIGLRAFSGKDLAKGLVIGSALLFASAGFAVAGGAAHFDPKFAVSGKLLGAILIPSITVPIIEEILFRGAIFTSLRKTWNTAAALWISSAIYAIVHFFARPENPAHVEWNSGFVVLGGMLAGFGNWHSVIPGFFTLTLLGALLALAFLKTGALYLSMGIHSAAIFWIKLFNAATNPVPSANHWLWGSEKLIDGWLSFFVLGAATILMARWKPKQNTP